MDKILKIGTRGSPLALIQTGMVMDALRRAHPTLLMEQIIIKTSGDWHPKDGEIRLSEAQGGKGLFARELEQSLLRGEIDCAVHSMKDMPSFLDSGLALDHVLERANPFDAFISHKAHHYMDLPKGAVVGTSSMRRQAFLLAKRPDLKVVPLRGNVQTRLDKLQQGMADATFLAMAGLERLGISGDHIHALDESDMLPACGQGIIAIETRDGDNNVRSLLSSIHHIQTGLCGSCERAALQILDGSCHTPIGAYARFDADGMMIFDVSVASLNGTQIFSKTGTAKIENIPQAQAFGATLAEQLKTIAPSDIWS